MTSLAFVRQLLADYLSLPFVSPHQPSSRERALAHQLYDRNLCLSTLRAAFLLAAARRSPLLPPVRSLSYFLPLIEELSFDPPDPDYIAFLALKLRASVHFSALSHDR